MNVSLSSSVDNSTLFFIRNNVPPFSNAPHISKVEASKAIAPV